MRSGTPAPEIDLLLRHLDYASNRTTWHGPNLRVPFAVWTLGWRQGPPSAGWHNIWEIVVHGAGQMQLLKRLARGR